MNIIIVGAGNVGAALGRGWRRAGHNVTFAVRDPNKRENSELRDSGFSVVPLAGAAAGADLVTLTVPWPAVGLRCRRSGL